MDKEFKRNASDLLEVNRKKKALDAESEGLRAVLLAALDAAGRDGWEDDTMAVPIVDRPGAKTADVKGLEAAGLLQFIRIGAPVRYVAPRWK